VENEAFLGTAEAAITSAIRMGAQLAEAYICNSKELKIEVREGRVETMKLAGNRGMGLRGQEQNSEGQPVKSNGKGRRCGQFREDRREGNSYNG
jgi:predicted Zn-dependent protease